MVEGSGGNEAVRTTEGRDGRIAGYSHSLVHVSLRSHCLGITIFKVLIGLDSLVKEMSVEEIEHR